MLHWMSEHLRRVVESTLGSETQALVVGLKELEWISCLSIDLRRGLNPEGREDEVRRLARAALIAPWDEHGVELALGPAARDTSIWSTTRRMGLAVPMPCGQKRRRVPRSGLPLSSSRTRPTQ